jgi:hypothetical protein
MEAMNVEINQGEKELNPKWKIRRCLWKSFGAMKK